jgi:hypothetical protein
VPAPSGVSVAKALAFRPAIADLRVPGLCLGNVVVNGGVLGADRQPITHGKGESKLNAKYSEAATIALELPSRDHSAERGRRGFRNVIQPSSR